VSDENRETFFKRLEPFLAPSELLDVQLAYTLSKYGHRAQVRKEKDDAGQPIRYFEHPRRVTLILLDEVQIHDRDLTIAALLHDGIEDTKDLTPEMIEHCFGADVVRIVKTLSKVPKDGYLERFKASVDWRPYVIKACDRLDNLRSLDGCDREFMEKQAIETETKYYPLFNRMVELTPVGHRARVEMLESWIQYATGDVYRKCIYAKSASSV
jgi:GTP diphosphokinase / guanosine-3',5'-bis(diphosphate) 3'-diphosphatase